MAGEMIMVTGPMRFNDYTVQFSPDRYQFATGLDKLFYLSNRSQSCNRQKFFTYFGYKYLKSLQKETCGYLP